MTIQVRTSTATTVRMVTDGTWSSPTLTITDPDGGTVSGGSAALDSTSTTLASAPTYAYSLSLTSATGFVVGRRYQVTTDSVASIFRVTRIDGSTIEVDPAPALMPEAGDTVAGVEVSVSVPAISTRGHGYQIVLTEGDKEEREDLDVVRRLFLLDFRDFDLRRMLAEGWPSSAVSEVAIDVLVGDVREEIRGMMLARGAYPHEWISASAFRQLGHEVARRLLAKRYGLFPQGVSDREDYLREVRADEGRYLSQIVNSWRPADTDDDGVVDTPTVRRFSGRKSR